MVETFSLRSFNIRWEDIVEVIIISFLLYQIMAWAKHTKVWLLMKKKFYHECDHV